jgi:hypothetical protein
LRTFALCKWFLSAPASTLIGRTPNTNEASTRARAYRGLQLLTHVDGDELIFS